MINLAIICPSEIAVRRFMPALKELEDFNFCGVAVYSEEEYLEFADNNVNIKEKIANARIKASGIVEMYGGKVYNSYLSLLEDDNIDAVYIPLPPALHYKWAKVALENNKNVLLEKPFTVDYSLTSELVKIAEERKLAIHENYMFVYHNQLSQIKMMLSNGELGKLRLARIDFGFPKRPDGDFRYNKALGGGAIYDTAGYTVKLVTELFGTDVKIVHSKSVYEEGCDVDIAGSAVVETKDGGIIQVGYGMDNEYKCNLELWGSKGNMLSTRILTAPAGFMPKAYIKKSNEEIELTLEADDTFKKSIIDFKEMMISNVRRRQSYDIIIKQAMLMEELKKGE